jgi:hypothetical protein
MQKWNQTIVRWVACIAASLALLLSISNPAVAETPSKLRYGYQKDKQYAYNVKIVADLSEEEVTQEGTLDYTILSDTKEQFVMKCWGHLGFSVKRTSNNISGGFGPNSPIPNPAFFGGPPGIHGYPNRSEGTTFDRLGKIIMFGNPHSLSLLLGDQIELIVESLPAEEKTNWSKETDLGVIERSGSGPFFRPFGLGASETNRGAKERIDYAILETKDDIVRIGKTYSLKTAEQDGINHIDMSGNGEFEFDVKQGLIKSLSMKYSILVKEKNITETIPVTLTYKMLTEAEMAERKKKSEEAAAVQAEANKPKPFQPGEREKLVKDLLSKDDKRIAEAAKRLAKSIRDDEPADISKALCRAFKKSNDWVQKDILAALAIWHTPEAEKTAIDASKNKCFFVRAAGIELLGKFKTKTAAEAAIAAMPQNRNEAANALKAIGPIAETYTIPMLDDRDFWIRKATCEILGEIGGEKSLAALKNYILKADQGERHFIDKAIDALEKRLDSDDSEDSEDSEEPEAAPAKEGAPQAAGAPTMHTWRDVSGTYAVEATFVKSEGEKVTIKKTDGKTITLQIKKLSKADQEYVKQLIEAEKNKPDNPFE